MTYHHDCLEINSRIQKICLRKGFSLYQLAKRSGVSYSVLSSMFRRGTQPSLNTLHKLCIGLDISLSDFFADNDIVTPQLNDTSRKLVELFNRLPSEKQMLLMSYLYGLCDSEFASLLE